MRQLTDDELDQLFEDDAHTPSTGVEILHDESILEYVGGDRFILLKTGGLLGHGDDETVLWTEVNREAHVLPTEAATRAAMDKDIWRLAKAMCAKSLGEDVVIIGEEIPEDIESLHWVGDEDSEWWVISRAPDGAVTTEKCDSAGEALEAAADTADEQSDTPESEQEAVAWARLQLFASEGWEHVVAEGDIQASWPEIPDTEDGDCDVNPADLEYVMLRWRDRWHAVLTAWGDYRLMNSQEDALWYIARNMGDPGPTVTWASNDFVRTYGAVLCYGVGDEAGWRRYDTEPEAERAAAAMLEQTADRLELHLGDDPTVEQRVTPHYLRRAAAQLREAPANAALGAIIREEHDNGRLGRETKERGGITTSGLATLMGVNRRWVYDTINGKGW